MNAFSIIKSQMARVDSVVRWVCCLFSLAFFLPPNAVADYEGVFRIGTASKVGTFYRATAAFCAQVNRENHRYCVPIATNGSLHNLNLLASHKLDLAVVKSDVALALDQIGLSTSTLARIDEIQVVAKLHDMPLTIIGAGDGESELSAAMLEGKTVNIGAEGSGERIASLELFRAMGLDHRRMFTTNFDSRTVVKAFCDGETDIVIELIAHPANIYNALLNECGGRFLNLDPLVIREVMARNPYVFSAQVYDGYYTTSPRTYSTYAVSAILIANSDLDAELKALVLATLSTSVEAIKQDLPEWIHLQVPDFELDAPPRFKWQ